MTDRDPWEEWEDIEADEEEEVDGDLLEPGDAFAPDEALRNFDLMLENQALETDLQMMGAHSISFNPQGPSLPPELENQFLKQVMMFEAMDLIPKSDVHSLFPDDYAFPPAESLTEAERSARLADILAILHKHRIFIELRPSLPEALIYDYIVTEVLDEESCSLIPRLDFARFSTVAVAVATIASSAITATRVSIKRAAPRRCNPAPIPLASNHRLRQDD